MNGVCASPQVPVNNPLFTEEEKAPKVAIISVVALGILFSTQVGRFVASIALRNVSILATLGGTVYLVARLFFSYFSRSVSALNEKLDHIRYRITDQEVEKLCQDLKDGKYPALKKALCQCDPYDMSENMKLLKACLAAGFDIDKSFFWGETVLMIASKQLCVEVVAFLLANDAKVDLVDRDGLTALEKVMRKGCKNLIDTAERLKKEVEALEKTLENQNAYLRANRFDWLTKSRASITRDQLSCKKTELETCLKKKQAFEEKRLAIVKALINAGANIHQKNKDGKSLIKQAFEAKWWELVQILLKAGAQPYKEKEVEEGFFYRPHFLGYSEIVDAFIELREGGDQEKSLAPIAYVLVSLQDQEEVKRLLSHRGVDWDKYMSDAYEVLTLAAESGDLESVKKLLDIGVNVNQRDRSGTTALMRASRKGNLAAVNTLLASGADFNQVDNQGKSALEFAFKGNHWRVVKALLDKGVDPDKQMGMECRETLLMRASSLGCLEMVGVLLDSDVDRDQADLFGQTALMHAALKNQVEVAKLLLERGADMNKVHSYGRTALMLATERGYLEMVQVLLNSASVDVNAMDQGGNTALAIAFVKRNLEMISALLKSGANPDRVDRQGMSLLSLAVERGCWEIVRFVLENHYTVGKGRQSEEAVFEAVLNSRYLGESSDTIRATLEALETEEVLLEKKIKKQIADRSWYGQEWFTLDEKKEFSKQLSSLKNRIAEKKKSLQSRLAEELVFEKERWAIVGMLIKAGADPNQVEIEGKTLLDRVCEAEQWELVQTLLKAGADPNKVRKGRLAPLNRAAIEGHKEVVKALLDNGADVNCTNHRGYTALMHASSNGHLEVVRALLGKGAEVDKVVEKNGDEMELVKRNGGSYRTALSYASENGHLEVVKILLSAGADSRKKDSNNKMAVDYASEEGHKEVLKLLLESDAAVNQDGKTALIMAV